ncbi:MAG: hypothetical protein FWE04_00085 [Oscillospiraceae bacterium]|nr:hypothetical protein [Oscillospiraceae bacterium]
MDLQKMLSQISPEQLQQGMKQLGLTPEQMNQVKNVANGGSTDNINMNEVNEVLKKNPNLEKQLKQANMLNKISEIFGK